MEEKMKFKAKLSMLALLGVMVLSISVPSAFADTTNLNLTGAKTQNSIIVKEVPFDLKQAYRNEFKIVVSGGRTKGFAVASNLLEHSLMDNPSNMNCYNGSTVVNEVLKCSAYKKLSAKLKSEYNAKGRKAFSRKILASEITFNKDGTTIGSDLYYGIHGTWGGTVKVDVKGNATIMIKDYYDYAQAGDYGMSIGGMLSNEAYKAQTYGAIQNYYLYIYVSEKF